MSWPRSCTVRNSWSIMGMPGDFAADYQQATLYIKRLEATVVPMDDAPLWAHQLKNDFNEMCNTVNEMHNTVNEMHNTVKEMYNTVNETNNRLLRVEETLDNMTDVKNIAKEQAKMWNLSQLSGSSGSVGGSESTKARDKEKGRAIKSIRGE
ncbi:hypothetical protein DENSPDRAFT_100347 [Dentipellis sp. KUC8613]|nr:hypothetical protein DENSPDRAFT_100347 [Dentipellis sp. KUC8613]